MNYAKWMDLDEFKNNLTPVNKERKITKSGVPLTYDEKNLYIDTKGVHTLVIGSTGSGRTQAITLTQTKLAIKAGESIVINDMKGEIYNSVSGELKKQNYKTFIVDFDEPTLGNHYNPLTLAKELYQTNKDKCIDILESIGYYFFSTRNSNNSDPFWENSAINLFIGLTLYLFETKESVTLSDVYKLSLELETENLLAKVSKNSIIYMYLSGTLKAPKETKGSIISVFNQKINLYTCRENLANLLSKTDFDLKELANGKCALFIISGDKPYVQNLTSLLITQVYESIYLSKKTDNRVNVIIDDFEKIYPIKNIEMLLTNSRSINIRYTLLIKSLLDLKNNYGKEKTELIKMCIGNIIYLLANDIETLEEISKMCGNTEVLGKIMPLVTVEELKLMKQFEAIVLIPRMLPIKTKLLPNYQMDFDFSKEQIEISKMN